MLTQRQHDHEMKPSAEVPISDRLSDCQLLKRFTRDKREDAFAELVDRHAAMVLGVCRQILRDQHDAEDAFQATFLVLAQKAGRIRWKEGVGPWLFQVAHRTAMGAARLKQRRRMQELDESVLTEDDQQWREITEQEQQAAIYEELLELPERYRAPLILCYMEEMTHVEAANQLGCSNGVVKGRLTRGKQMLRMRLARRGMEVTAALAAVAVGSSACQAATISPLVATTTQTCAAAVLHGNMTAVAANISNLASLTEQGFTIMNTANSVRMALATALLLSAGLSWAALAYFSETAVADEPIASTELAPSLKEETLEDVYVRVADDPAPSAPVKIYQQWKGEYSGATKAGNHVVKDGKQWQLIWAEIYANQSPAPALPAIDFEKQTVLVALQGEKPSGSHAIEIVVISKAPDKVIARVKDMSPRPDEPVDSAMTAPYHAVVIDKLSLPIKFVTTQGAMPPDTVTLSLFEYLRLRLKGQIADEEADPLDGGDDNGEPTPKEAPIPADEPTPDDLPTPADKPSPDSLPQLRSLGEFPTACLPEKEAPKPSSSGNKPKAGCLIACEPAPKQPSSGSNGDKPKSGCLSVESSIACLPAPKPTKGSGDNPQSTPRCLTVESAVACKPATGSSDCFVLSQFAYCLPETEADEETQQPKTGCLIWV